MNLKDYAKNVMLTAAVCQKENYPDADLLHSIMGICTESGELMDVMKRKLAYGKEVDKVNIKEELGDLMWYVMLACESQGYDIEDIMEKNIAKLKVRFPNKFTLQDSLNRDLNAERKVLED